MLLSSAKAKSGLFREMHVPVPRTSQCRLFRRRLTGFAVTHPVTSMSSLAVLGGLARSLQLAVNDNES